MYIYLYMYMFIYCTYNKLQGIHTHTDTYYDPGGYQNQFFDFPLANLFGTFSAFSELATK